MREKSNLLNLQAFLFSTSLLLSSSLPVVGFLLSYLINSFILISSRSPFPPYSLLLGALCFAFSCPFSEHHQISSHISSEGDLIFYNFCSFFIILKLIVLFFMFYESNSCHLKIAIMGGETKMAA